MTRSTRHTSSARWQRGVTLALALGLQTQLLSSSWAQSTPPTAPSQNPLISLSNLVPPNLMVTLDSSWSMIFPYMPEGTVKLPGGNVNFPGFTSPVMHPDDNRYTVDQGRVWGDGGAIPGDHTASAGVFQMQMRSPDVNSLYYDPAVTYKPWITSQKDSITGEYKRYPPADPAKALFDPDKPTASGTAPYYANLTLVESSRKATWCPTNPASGDKLKCVESLKPFNPGLYYRLEGADSACPKVSVVENGVTVLYPNPKDVRCFTKYDINSGASFKKYKARTDCAGTTCTAAEEKQNFANWFVYYRTRLHIAEASLPETFLQLKDNKLRVGWGTIHKGISDIDGKGMPTKNVIEGVRTLDAPRKQALVNWIRAFKSDATISTAPNDPTDYARLRGGTPLMAAVTGVGDYFSRTDGRSPWATDMENGDPIPSKALSCRRSYNLLITDGYYTDDTPKSTVNGNTITIGKEDEAPGDIKGKAITGPINPDYLYPAVKPYADDCPGTLADAAMHYWKNDLRIDVDNRIPAGKDNINENPAFWQNLVQFNIGLGVSGNIPYNDLDNELAKLTSGAKRWWPSGCAVSRADPVRVDDLLHAAINTHGRYFSVKTPVELTNALTTALGRASRQDGMKQGGVSLQTQYINASNVKYVPEFTSEQWFGDVKAYDAAPTASGMAWSAKPAWSATDVVPAPADRNIVTWTGSVGAPFNWGTLGASNLATLKATLPTDATETQVVDYIRGDRSQEDTATQLKLFRQRDGLLGDFVNSTPTLLKGKVDLAYSKLPTGPAQASYAAYLAQKAARSPLLFLGDNGGMLHAFADYDASKDPDPLNPSKARGQEVFAFVPQAAIGGLGSFSQRDYGSVNNPHRYLVDGPLTESDAYLNGAWRNVLIGSMGAGGRAIFALDVTPGKKLDASAVMWEKSSADDPDLGYIMGQAEVGLLPGAGWKAFVGNGPYSANGHAVLMIIDLATGKIDKVDVSAGTEKGNALGAVRLVKDSSQQITAIYAGDLLGRMWRFDVNPATGAVSLGLSGQPLFKTPVTTANGADVAQPITAAPSITSHPLGGYMVLFGTGKLYDETDTTTVAMQSLYAVWDAPANLTSGQNNVNLSKGDLVEQKILPNAVASNDKQSYFDMDLQNVDYKAKHGWFVDLTLEKGQRLIYPSTLIQGFVLMRTVVPPHPKDTPTCEAVQGTAYTFFLNVLMDGSYTKTQILDTDGDGLITDADKISSVYSSPFDGPGEVTRKDATRTGNGGGGETTTTCSSEPDLFTDNQVSVSQVGGLRRTGTCKIRSRIWRQLLNPPQPAP